MFCTRRNKIRSDNGAFARKSGEQSGALRKIQNHHMKTLRASCVVVLHHPCGGAKNKRTCARQSKMVRAGFEPLHQNAGHFDVLGFCLPLRWGKKIRVPRLWYIEKRSIAHSERRFAIDGIQNLHMETLRVSCVVVLHHPCGGAKKYGYHDCGTRIFFGTP